VGVEPFKHLRVYQCARLFSKNVYETTKRFPDRHRKLAAQLDDAAESIASNISEGCGRKDVDLGNAELIRFLHFSSASAAECQSRLAGGLDRELVSEAQYWRMENQARLIKKMLASWIRKLKDNDRGRRAR